MLTIILAGFDAFGSAEFSWLYMATFFLDCEIIDTMYRVFKK